MARPLNAEREMFERYVHALIPWGGIVSLVDENSDLLVPEPVVLYVRSAQVLDARNNGEGELVYDVLWSHTPEPSPDTDLLTTITDPGEDIPGRGTRFVLRDTEGYEIGSTYVLVSNPPTEKAADRIGAMP